MITQALPLADRIKTALRLEPMSRRELALVLDVTKMKLTEETQILEARGEIRRLGKTTLWVNVSAPKLRASRRVVPDTCSVLYRAVEMS